MPLPGALIQQVITIFNDRVYNSHYKLLPYFLEKVLFIFKLCFMILLVKYDVLKTLSILDSVGEGEGGMFRENSIETCILSRVKQITSPGCMHETSAWGWCTGKTQRDRVEREMGGGIGMGNTCKSMADSCQCMAKTTTIL